MYNKILTIDNQIREEKLQYDINREAARISALSSNKFNKCECLTGEEILPSNQKQMIQQAKFTYSPLGKAFEKQIKTIEDQGEKQIKAIQNQGPIKTIKKYAFDDEDSPLISKQKEIFNELANKRLNEITELDKKVNLHDLVYRYKGKTPNEKFNTYDNALELVNKIKNDKIKLAEAKNDQIRLKSSLGEIKKETTKKDQRSKKTHYTILTCFTKQETRLLNFMMIILHWYLKQKIKPKMKQQKVRDSKY